MSCSASELAIAAAPAGTVSDAVMVKTGLSGNASTRTWPSRGFPVVTSRPRSSIVFCRTGLVVASVAYVADRFCATRSWL